MSANDDTPVQPSTDSPATDRRSASTSLQAAAAMNAGLQRDASRQSSLSSSIPNGQSPNPTRQRSAIMTNLQINDPSLPAPGEMTSEQPVHYSSALHNQPEPSLHADPHHHRAPSLGELHQELEAEQEAHVNRLLQMIRQQQLELQRLQAGQPQHGQSAVEDNSAVSDRSGRGTPQPSSASQTPLSAAPNVGSLPRSHGMSHTRGSVDISRGDLHRRSRTPSRGPSPRLRSTSISAESGDWVLGGRDESAFYQAETQMMVRENQMLRHRIRDLEKQLAETSVSPTAPSEPTVPSQLARAATTAEEDAGQNK